MISSDTHIIRQQIFDISYTGSTTDGISLQQKMISLCTDEFIPILEKILNRYTHIKGHVYLDRLEIDLGTFQSDEIEYKLAQAFREKLEFLLTEPSLQALVSATENDVQSKGDHFRFTDDITSFAEALIYFLQTGRLPWMFRLPPGRSLNQVLREILSGPEREVIMYKIKASLQYPMMVQRMILQLEEATILEILHFVSKAQAMRVEKLLTLFPKTTYASFRQAILKSAFVRLTSENTAQTEGEILELAIELAIELVRSDPQASPPIKPGDIIEVARKHHVDIKPKVLPKGHSREDRSIAPGSSFPLSADDAQGVYIDNAGLVLLHPFLPILFEGTGILQNDKIVDPDRALFLLHYLCTGQKEAPEYELTFPKIICGIPVDEPVSSSIILQPHEIEEADGLLTAVIRHWSALQHTSHDGLRGTFLLRHGKLSAAFDGGWLLQVERQSFDILLDSLPWGIGIVKLPWLPQLIHVEW